MDAKLRYILNYLVKKIVMNFQYYVSLFNETIVKQIKSTFCF